MNYSTYEEFHDLMRNLFHKKYTVAMENIIYLEELYSRNFIVYITQLRDALNHISNIFLLEDIFSAENKKRVLSNLEKIDGHVERIVFDTFKKICDYYVGNISKLSSEQIWISQRTQIAAKVRDLRISNPNTNYDEKKEGYVSLIKFLEEMLRTRE